MSSQARDHNDNQAEEPQSSPNDSQAIKVKVNESPGAKVITAGGDAYIFSISNISIFTLGGALRDSDMGKAMAEGIVSAIKNARKELEQHPEKPAEREVVQEPPKGLQEEVERWFRHELVTAREKYFVITLSLFNGLKWSDFWDIYQAILESKKLLQHEGEEYEAALFERTDEELVAKAKARIVFDDEQAAEIIEFKDTQDQSSQYQRVILELMRTRFRPRLVELLATLGKLGEHPYWQIRTRAAYAVAEIAKLDFHRARRQVLETWAQDNRPYVRAAIGYMTSHLVEDQAWGPQTSKMLEEWANPKENRNWKFRWAAAAAYKQIGLTHPEIALPGLKLVARNDDIRVADAVIYALLVISFDDKLEAVLQALGEWLEEEGGEETVVPLVATLAFLALGNAYTGLAEQEAEGKEEKTGDRLLALLAADSEGTCRSIVTAALFKALKYKLTDEAFDVLKGWAKQTQGDDARFNAVRDLIADWYMALYEDRHQIGTEGTWNRLQLWAQDENDAVKALAQATLEEIRRRTDAASLPSSPYKATGKAIVFGS